jgi:hypothetical protein
MLQLYVSSIIFGLIFAYTGLTYVRSGTIRLANRPVLTDRKAVFAGWSLFALSMTTVFAGFTAVLEGPI